MRSLRWSSWLGLGAFIVIAAASCSSSDSKKKPVPYVPIESGENAGGNASVTAGGDTSAGGAVTPSGGAAGDNTGGDNAGTMTDGWLSGTRLRATLYVSGSSKMFKTWHDTLLDHDCSFSYDANGDERCLPTIEQGSAMYGDSKCTQPVLVLDADADVPDLTMEPKPTFECHKNAHYVKVGATAAGVTDLFTTSSNGTCQPNGSLQATQVAKTLGAAIPESMFVAATGVVQETRDARLSANVLVAEDGSRRVLDHFDLERKASCEPRQHEGDGYGCVPVDKAYIEYFFADDKCMTEVAYHPAYAQQVCGSAPTIVQESKPFYTDDYYEVGELVSPIYRKDTDCVAYVSPGDPGATYYTVGTAVAFTSFAALSSKNEGKGRMLLQVLRDDAKTLVSREAFYDDKLGFSCGLGEATDHEVRCLPAPAGDVNFFTDSQCQQGLLVTAVGEAPNAFSSFLTTNAPAGGSYVYKLGAKITKPAKLYQSNGLSCDETLAADNLDYYATTLIAASELSPITLETE